MTVAGYLRTSSLFACALIVQVAFTHASDTTVTVEEFNKRCSSLLGGKALQEDIFSCLKRRNTLSGGKKWPRNIRKEWYLRPDK